MELRDCDYCGYEVDTDYIFTCPKCDREGCSECMPMGRGCVCPECEDELEAE